MPVPPENLLQTAMDPDDYLADDPSRPVGIVAFDFDGTLTVRDSFTDFLSWNAGALAWLRGLVALAPDAVQYLANRDRGLLKGAAARRFLAGTPLHDLEARARAYAEARSRSLLRPDALNSWRYWRSRGATLVIVTASPEYLVAPFARGLGADHLLGTRLALDADERLTGDLDGANCRGPEKVRRLRETFGEDVRLTAAYGDTSGDREMLAIAVHAGFREFRESP